MAILVTNAVQIARFANALYGIKLGYNTNAAVSDDIADLGLAATVNAYYNYSFGSKTSAEVANIILGNVGLTGNAAAEAFIIGQLNAAGTAKGAAVLGMLNAFANLTSDATFGAAATAWNSTVASAQVYTASNPEDVAATATTIQTYVLQPNVEVVTRTAGDDIIMAPAFSMNTFDVTDGGAGFDTLVISGEDSSLVTSASKGTFTNIEKVILNSFEGYLEEVNANEYQGVQQIWFEKTSNDGIDVNKLSNNITLGFKGENAMEGLDIFYSDSATTSNIVLDGQKGEISSEVEGKGLTVLNLSGSVAVDPATGMPLGGIYIETGYPDSKTTKLTTVNVTTTSAIALDIDTSYNKHINKIDASQSTGNVFAKIRLADESNTNGGSVGVTYLGGSGNDYVAAHLHDLDTKDSLKGGDGNDRLMLRLELGDEDLDNIIDDGDYAGGIFEGDYHLSATDYALINKAEFEQIDFEAGGVSQDQWMVIDAAKLTAKKIGVDEDSVLMNLESNDTVISTYSGDNEITVDLLAKRDAINPKKFAEGAGTVNLISEVKGETINVSPNFGLDGKLGASDGDDGVWVSEEGDYYLNDFSDFAKLIVTGAGDVHMGNIYGYGVEIDASGLKGALDIELSYDAVDKITLGAGKDEVHLFDAGVAAADASGEVDGNDYFDALSDYGNMDTITGFTSGQDKFVVNGNISDAKEGVQHLAYTGELGVDFSQTVSLALMAAKDAGADVASFVWSGNTYVVQDVFTDSVDWTGDFEAADDIVVKLTGVVSLASTDFVDYYA